MLISCKVFAADNAITVKIKDRSEPQFKIAAAQALMENLVKLSGNTAIADVPAIVDEMSRAQGYVTQKAYISTVDEQGKEALSLQLEFDAKELQNILERADQAVWQGKRPQMIAWLLIYDKQHQMQRLSPTMPAAEPLIKEATLRGIALSLPALEQEETESEIETAITNLNVKALESSMKRYPHSGVWMGQVTFDEHLNKWRGQWLYTQKGFETRWSTVGKATEIVLQDGLSAVVDKLAEQQQHALKTEPVIIQVQGVHDLQGFQQLAEALKKLTIVPEVALQQIQADSVKVEVQVQGGEAALQKAIAISGPLLPLAEPQTYRVKKAEAL